MLGYEERDGTAADAVRILMNDVIAHHLHAFVLVALEILAYDPCARVERDAMANLGMVAEEVVQQSVVVLLRSVQGKRQRLDVHLREVVLHVVAEPHLAVFLLLRGSVALPALLHQHDGGVASCDQHQDLSSEIATLEGVLAKESKRLKICHIGIEQDQGDACRMEFVGKGFGLLTCRRHEDHTIRIEQHAVGSSILKRLCVEATVVDELHVDLEVAAKLHGLYHTVLHLVPIRLARMARHQTIEREGAIIRQGAGVHIRLIVEFLEDVIHFGQRRCRHIGPIM